MTCTNRIDPEDDNSPVCDEKMCQECIQKSYEEFMRSEGLTAGQRVRQPTYDQQTGYHCDEYFSFEEPGICPFCGKDAPTAADHRAAQIDRADDLRKYGP